VIGDDDAFLVVANGHDTFADAVREKLSIEIAGLTPKIRLAAAHSGPPVSANSEFTALQNKNSLLRQNLIANQLS
jgi:hypothetical protein